MTPGWLVIAPLVLAWAGVMIDIALQPRMPGAVKLSWAVACTLIWPLLIVYWLTRPMQGRAERPQRGEDPRGRLVAAVLGREYGLVGPDELESLGRELREAASNDPGGRQME